MKTAGLRSVAWKQYYQLLSVEFLHKDPLFYFLVYKMSLFSPQLLLSPEPQRWSQTRRVRAAESPIESTCAAVPGGGDLGLGFGY